MSEDDDKNGPISGSLSLQGGGGGGVVAEDTTEETQDTNNMDTNIMETNLTMNQNEDKINDVDNKSGSSPRSLSLQHSGKGSVVIEITPEDIDELNQMQTNSMIVDLIANELPIDDLSTLRQSCKSWNESFHQLQREQLSRTDFQDFFAVVCQSIKTLTLECKWRKEEVNMDRIREVVFELTPQLTNLSLTLDVEKPEVAEGTNTSAPAPLENMEIMEKWSFSVTPPTTLPNLQVLSLIMPLSSNLVPVQGELIADLLTSATRLECLSLKAVQSWRVVPQILTTLLDSMPRLTNLKTLHLPGLEAEQIKFLAVELAPHLRLQNLVMSVVLRKDVGSHQETADLLHQFLCTQAGSLREFRLGVTNYDNRTYQDGGGVPFRIPRLEQLRTFGFRRLASGGVLVHYDGGTIGANFPRLKRLEYKYTLYKDSDSDSEGEGGADLGMVLDAQAQRDDLNRIFHDGVTELVLDVVEEEDSIEFDANIFRERLPSVRKLDFGCESSLLNPLPPFTIWTAWPELTSVRLRYKSEFDIEGKLEQLLTGVPRDCPDLLIIEDPADWVQTKLQLGTTEAYQEFRHFLQNSKTNPSLSDLKKLEDFKLVLTVEDISVDTYFEPAKGRWEVPLGDFGGCLGLAMSNPGLLRMEIHLEPYHSGPRFPSNWTHKELFTSKCKEFIKSSFAPHASINIQISDSCYNQEPNYFD